MGVGIPYKVIEMLLVTVENGALLIENDYHYVEYQLPNIVCVLEIYRKCNSVINAF